MSTNLQSFSDLMHKSIYKLPDFQRGYAWRKKELDDFWQDLEELGPGENHYTGVITLERVPDEKYRHWPEYETLILEWGYQSYYIVDGQQRLTTTVILLKAILNAVAESTFLSKPKENWEQELIGWLPRGSMQTYHYLGYENDSSSEEVLHGFLRGMDVMQVSPTMYTRNLQFAMEYFKSRIERLSISALESLFQKVILNLKFNKVIMTNEIDIFVAFETMNNRGLSLTNLEKLKNRLMYITNKGAKLPDVRQRYRETIGNAWRSVYTVLGKYNQDVIQDDEFLRLAVQFYMRGESDRMQYTPWVENTPLTHRSYFEWLEKRFTYRSFAAHLPNSKSLSEIENFVSEMGVALSAWELAYKGESGSASRELLEVVRRLQRFNSERLRFLLFHYIVREQSDILRIEFCQKLERLRLIQTLLLSTRRGLQRSFEVEYVVDFSNVKSAEEIKEIVETNLRNIEVLLGHKASKQKLLESRAWRGFYEWEDLPYFLQLYEESLCKQSLTLKEKLKWREWATDVDNTVAVENQTIEHIMPKSFPPNKEWPSIVGIEESKHKVLVNSLGNLLPLTRRRNSSFGRRSFFRKVHGSRNIKGYSQGNYSENEVAVYEVWSQDEILERGLKMFSLLSDICSFQSWSEGDRLLILGFNTRRQLTSIRSDNKGFKNIVDDFKVHLLSKKSCYLEV